jgi:hypothetical protein
VLRVGGLAFDATSSVPFQPPAHPPYPDFLAARPEEGDDVIAVALDPGDPVIPPDAARTFDTGSAWSAYAFPDGDAAIVMALPAAREAPLVLARFDREVTRVRVTCSPRLDTEGRFWSPLCYPLDQLLTVHRLAREGGMVVHCALVDVGGAGVLCPGVSGAGKTTLSRQLLGAGGLRVLSDDRAVVRRSGTAYRAYGTPWPGDGGFAVNTSVPLVGVGFIEHRAVPETTPLTPGEAIRRLVRVASIPLYDREAAGRVFDGLTDLCGRVAVWRLGVPASPAAADAVRALGEGRPLPTSPS